MFYKIVKCFIFGYDSREGALPTNLLYSLSTTTLSIRNSNDECCNAECHFLNAIMLMVMAALFHRFLAFKEFLSPAK